MCSHHDPLQATQLDVVVFLCGIADGSERPASQLKSAVAAINCMYNALNEQSPAQDPDVSRLLTALTKSATTSPASRTAIMAIQPFHDLFSSWPDNDDLILEDLRLKAVTLMAIAFMARPSDLAPKGVFFDPATLSVKGHVFSTDNIHFHQDGSMTVHFFATKNDTQRTGFEVNLPGAADSRIDPVHCLQVYIQRTSGFRPMDTRPVFLPLRPPYKALGSASISRILAQAKR